MSNSSDPNETDGSSLLVGEGLERWDPVLVQSGEEFFESLLLDPYLSWLWQILKQSQDGIRVLRVGGSEQVVMIITNSLVLETTSVEA